MLKKPKGKGNVSLCGCRWLVKALKAAVLQAFAVPLFLMIRMKQSKLAAVAGQHTVVPEFAQLCRHGTALNTQKIRQFLPVKGNGKTVGIVKLGLGKQVGHQLITGCSLGENFNLLVKCQILFSHYLHKIHNKLIMKCARIGATAQDPATVNT